MGTTQTKHQLHRIGKTVMKREGDKKKKKGVGVVVGWWWGWGVGGVGGGGGGSGGTTLTYLSDEVRHLFVTAASQIEQKCQTLSDISATIIVSI